MKKFLEKLFLNAKIIDAYRICDLVCFVFETENGAKLHLHIQCLLRIFDTDGVLVVCSANMSDRSPGYHKKWYKKFDWTERGSTIFDDALKENKDELFTAKVSEIRFENDDINFRFNNGMRMDVITLITKYDDPDYSENYRIFNKLSGEEYLIV